MKFYQHILCAFLGLMFIPLSLSAHDDQEADIDLDWVIENFERIEKELFFQQESIYVQYTSIVAEKNILKPNEKNPYLPVQYINGYDNQIYGVKSILASHNTQNTEGITYYATKGNVIDWREDSNHAVVSQFEYGRNMYHNWYYFQNYGIVPFRALAENNGVLYKDVLKQSLKDPSLEPLRNFILPDSLKENKDKYIVLPEQESIEGHDCYVIEWPNTDKIWIDLEIGGAIRKRISHWSENGFLRSMIINSDFKKLGSELFLPMKQEVTNFVGPNMGLSQNLWGKEFSHFIYKVNSIQIGRLNPEAHKFFDVRLPEGTSVYDVRYGTDYRVSNPNSDPFAGPIGQGIKANRFVMYRAIIIFVASTIILIAVWMKFRKKATI